MITQLIYNQEVIRVWREHQIGQWTCQSDVSDIYWQTQMSYVHISNPSSIFKRSNSIYRLDW